MLSIGFELPLVGQKQISCIHVSNLFIHYLCIYVGLCVDMHFLCLKKSEDKSGKMLMSTHDFLYPYE